MHKTTLQCVSETTQNKTNLAVTVAARIHAVFNNPIGKSTTNGR